MNTRNKFACLSSELNTHKYNFGIWSPAASSSFPFQAFFFSSSSSSYFNDYSWSMIDQKEYKIQMDVELVIRWKSLFTIMKSRLTIDEPKVRQEVYVSLKQANTRKKKNELHKRRLCFPGNDFLKWHWSEYISHFRFLCFLCYLICVGNFLSLKCAHELWILPIQTRARSR